MNARSAPSRLRLLAVCTLAGVVASAPLQSFAQGREQFGTALQALTATLAGQGGGTGASVDRAVDDLAHALSLWDARISSSGLQLQARIAHASPREAAQFHLSLGVLYFERGRVAEALTEFSEATRLDQAMPTAWLMRAYTLDALNQSTEARNGFATALALRPDDPVAAYCLARLTPSGDDPAALLPTTKVLMSAAERLRAAPDSSSSPFVDVSVLDDRSPPRHRFLPAGYGTVIVPLLSARKYDDVVKAFRTLIARDPQRHDPALSSEAFAAAALEIEGGRAEVALTQLTKVEKALRGSSEFHRLRAAALTASSRAQEAVVELETAVRLAPANERAVVALLNVLLEQGHLARAERLASNAQTVVQRSVAIPWIQAQVYSALGRDADVVTALERALDAQPLAGAGAMWSTLGLFRMRRFDPNASDAFEHDVRLNPNRPEPHLLLGESLRSQGRINEALAEFVAAVLIQPDSVRAHLSLGQMHIEAGRYPEAISSLRWVVARQPGLNSAHHALANALLRVGHLDEAAKEFEIFKRGQVESIKADRNYRRVGALRLHAALLQQTGQWTQAVDVYKRLIELEPEIATNHVALAECLVRLGQYQLAAESLERAGALGASPVVLQRLADVYSRMGRFQESAEATRRYEALHERLRARGPAQ